MRWTVLLPVKALPAAKSRLLPASAGPDAHRRLVEAIRADTAAAARAATLVARVLLITDQPLTAESLAAQWPGHAGQDVMAQVAPGLNAALREGADLAARRWPADGVAALLADLPALRSAELDTSLAAAAHHPRGYVPDAIGTGTTLLASVPGIALAPAFGAGSARRHAARATPLPAGAGLRRDVDTADDLAEAALLGLGPATAAALGAGASRHVQLREA